MASTIQIRVDDEIKEKSDALFRQLGTDTTTAIRMFLCQAILRKGFPFEITMNQTEQIYAPLSEEELLLRLEQSRIHAEEGRLKDAGEIASGLRAKYGL